MRISDWSSDVCSSDLVGADCAGREDVLRPGETRIIPIGEHVAFEARIGVERTLDEELAVDALILDAVSDRPARRVRRIELAVGIARAEAQSRRPLARIDDAFGPARPQVRVRDRLDHLVTAPAALRPALAENYAAL